MEYHIIEVNPYCDWVLVMKMILKTITAGPLVHQMLYTNIRVQEDDNPATRQLKGDLRRAQRQWIRNQKLWAEAIILANFTECDFFCTLTFSPEERPNCRAESNRRFNYFVKKLRRGEKLIRYIKCVEHKHGAAHYHIHAIISGATAAEIRGSWLYGRACVQRFDPGQAVPHIGLDGVVHSGLAAYMVKERPDKLGQKCIQCSQRGSRLVHPQIEREFVPEHYDMAVPPDARLIRRSTPAENVFGMIQTQSYVHISTLQGDNKKLCP